MPLTTSRLNELTDSITAQLNTVRPTDRTWLQVVDFLDNDISTDPNPDTITYPSSINLTWDSSVNGSSSTANRPSLDNPINFAVEITKTARTVIFLQGSVIKGAMQMVSDVYGGSAFGFGAGLFFSYFSVSTNEV